MKRSALLALAARTTNRPFRASSRKTIAAGHPGCAPWEQIQDFCTRMHKNAQRVPFSAPPYSRVFACIRGPMFSWMRAQSCTNPRATHTKNCQLSTIGFDPQNPRPVHPHLEGEVHKPKIAHRNTAAQEKLQISAQFCTRMHKEFVFSAQPCKSPSARAALLFVFIRGPMFFALPGAGYPVVSFAQLY